MEIGDAPTNRVNKLLQFADGTLIVNPRFTKKILDGYGFVAIKRFTGVAAGSYIDVLFRNPSGSGRNVFTVLLTARGLAQLYLDIYFNNTITSLGNAIPIFNLNTGSDISPVAEAYYGGTYTLSSDALEDVVPGGSHVRAVGGATSLGEIFVLAPGKNIIARVTNASAADTDFSLKILWWEDPLS